MTAMTEPDDQRRTAPAPPPPQPQTFTQRGYPVFWENEPRWKSDMRGRGPLAIVILIVLVLAGAYNPVINAVMWLVRWIHGLL